MTATMTPASTVNGIDTEALRGAIQAISEDPSKGMTTWKVRSTWKGGTRNDTRVTEFGIGGRTVKRDFTIKVDEPLELCGTNQFANPQEYLLTALNSCMMVGYAAVCALEGIELQEMHIETEGDIDLRGFLGIDPAVKPGYDSLKYTVHLKGSASEDQFRKVHEFVMRTSPNRFNIANAIALNAQLVVG
jgi:uncharacterized OsmC-like protein